MATITIECEGAAAARVELPPGEYTLGADGDNAIVIEHPTVSHHHCSFFVQSDGHVIVSDAGSTNGLWVDGQSVTQAELVPGQSFQAGAARVTLDSTAPFPLPLPPRLPPALPRSQTAPAAQPPRPASAPVPGTLLQQAIGAFGYPLRGEAYLYIVMLVAIEFIPMFIPMILAGWIGLLVMVVVGAYLFVLCQQIVVSTAQGDDRFPLVPNIQLSREEYLAVYWHYLVLSFACFGPLIACNFIRTVPSWVPVVLAVICCFYSPMVVLAVMITDSFSVVNPWFIGRSILRIFRPYLALAAYCGLVAGCGYAASRMTRQAVPFEFSAARRLGFHVLGALQSALGFYLLFVFMRLLGLFYRRYEKHLGWTGGP